MIGWAAVHGTGIARPRDSEICCRAELCRRGARSFRRVPPPSRTHPRHHEGDDRAVVTLDGLGIRGAKMATKTEVGYFLPKSMVRLQATMRQLVDELEPARNTCEASEWVAELVAVADLARGRTVAVEGSWWFDYGMKLDLTEDGRLASAEVESTGQVGSVVASAAGLAVGVASAAIFRFPVLPVRLTETKGAGAEDSDFAPADDPSRQPDAAGERYALDHPGEARRFKALQVEYRTAVAAVAEARIEYREAREDDRVDAWSHYRRLVRMADDVASELDRARVLFDAWRRSKQTQTEFVTAAFVPVAALPLLTESVDGVLDFGWGQDAMAQAVRRFFDAVGWVLARCDGRDWALSEPNGSLEGQRPADSRLHVLRPRPVAFAAVRKGPSGQLRMVEFRRELITDRYCQELEVPLRKSWFAKRRTVVELASSGALTGLELGGASSANAVAGMASTVAANSVAALEAASKVRKALGELGAADREEELSRLKREVAIGEQQLVAAGQAATASDFARLEWLRQQVAIAEAKAKLTASTGGGT